MTEPGTPNEATQPAAGASEQPPVTGHERIDAALQQVAASGEPETITLALDVLQGVLDADPDDEQPPPAP